MFMFLCLLTTFFHGALSSLIIRVKLYLLLSFQGSNIFLFCTQYFINHFTTYLDMFCEKLLLFCCLKQTKPNIKYDAIFEWPSNRGTDFLFCVEIYASFYQISRLKSILIYHKILNSFFLFAISLNVLMTKLFNHCINHILYS